MKSTSDALPTAIETVLGTDTGLFFGEDNGTFGGGGYCVQDGTLHFASTTIIIYMAGLGETQIVSDLVAL